jgi:hypothetical protein
VCAHEHETKICAHLLGTNLRNTQDTRRDDSRLNSSARTTIQSSSESTGYNLSDSCVGVGSSETCSTLLSCERLSSA